MKAKLKPEPEPEEETEEEPEEEPEEEEIVRPKPATIKKPIPPPKQFKRPSRIPPPRREPTDEQLYDNANIEILRQRLYQQTRQRLQNDLFSY